MKRTMLYFVVNETNRMILKVYSKYGNALRFMDRHENTSITGYNYELYPEAKNMKENTIFKDL